MRVVLGEDLTLLRDGLIRLLTAYDMDVVAAVDSGPELLRALVTHRPDVAVVDVRLRPDFTDEGLKAAIEARARVPGLPVLVLSQHVEQLYARELLSAGTGGLGYLLKDRVSDVKRFIEAVRTVADGGTVMDPEVVYQLLARHARDEPLDRLTPREREVLGLMAEGLTKPASPPGCSSPRKRSASTSTTSSPSLTCTPPRTATAACWRCWPTSTPEAGSGSSPADGPPRSASQASSGQPSARRRVSWRGAGRARRTARPRRPGCRSTRPGPATGWRLPAFPSAARGPTRSPG